MTKANRYKDVLEELKQRLHIVDDEADDNLYRLMLASYEAIKRMCGYFSLTTNVRGKELVFERVRYVYNDVLEQFANNFLVEINNLAIELSVYEGDDYDEDVE